jgi:hypothetical protein
MTRVLLSLVVGLGAVTGAQSPPSALTAQETQIILAALDATALREARSLASGRAGRPTAVILDATLAFCPAEAARLGCIYASTRHTIERSAGGPDTSLARAFVSRNAAPLPVPKYDDRFIVAPAAELDAIFRRGFWREFNERFGRVGLVTFSAPGIADNGAIIYVTFSCGGLCGMTWLVQLERHADQFRVKTSTMLTIS